MCFNGPKVEGAFTLMNKTATEFRSSMSVRTLSAILSAQYRNQLYGSSVSQLPANQKLSAFQSISSLHAVCLEKVPPGSAGEAASCCQSGCELDSCNFI